MLSVILNLNDVGHYFIEARMLEYLIWIYFLFLTLNVDTLIQGFECEPSLSWKFPTVFNMLIMLG
jgi:hypothetical protein